MEPSPSAAHIQHQAQDQVQDTPSQVSNPGRSRKPGNHPRTRAPPANASTLDNAAAPPTDGSSTQPSKRDKGRNKRKGHQQGTSKPPRPPPSQAAGTRSTVVGGTDHGADAQHPETKPYRPPKHLQGRTTENAHQVADSVSAPPETNSQRPSRRSKFNASLSESTSVTGDSQTKPPTQASKKAKPPRPRIPPGDDLTSTLTRALSTHPYPDCPICFNNIRPEHHTWSCSSSDPSENLQSCWTTFHLKCIRAWAAKSVEDLQKAWRARGEERAGEWRCPGCQAKREQVPATYKCFCHRVTNPSPPRLVTPHSCAYPCSRARTSGCGHACPLSCHPGPCPPCGVTVRKNCWCGREVSSIRCSSLASPNSVVGVSCNLTCGKSLSCGNPQHKCPQVCHPGDCKPCDVVEVVNCYCGAEKKEVVCGDRKDKAVVCSTQGGIDWEGRYECDCVCGRPFACGVHTCEKGCHPPSSVPPRCPLDPSSMQTCACGRFALPTAVQYDQYTNSDQSIPTPKSNNEGKEIGYFLKPRTSCATPVLTCQQRCIKFLPDCSHQCGVNCHTGPCPPCTELVERSCRCGATTKKIKCSKTQGIGGETGEVLCDRPCQALRMCGRHQCNRICCPLAPLFAVQKGKGKKRAGLTQDELGIEEGGLHECDLQCGKMLTCGNHRCERKDHRGACGVCLQSVYEELFCPCGRTVMEPPIPCGTVMQCNYPCARPPPLCGHARVPHSCHAGVVVAGADPDQTGEESPCPPCPFLTSKQCACGKNMVDNIRCAQERVNCGTTCGKQLDCGFHHCERPCHGDACGTCTAVCGKPRKSCLPAHHPCTQTCHAPTACAEAEPCLALVTITCPCGLIRSSVPCSQTSSTTKLKCTGECAIKKRNARLADALGINPEKHDTMLGKVTYNEELITFARMNSKFMAIVEKTFADFVSSDKRTQVLPHMPPERRKFVHDLAAIYRMDTQMVDQEPYRSVQLIRRIDTRIPSPVLSASLTSQPSPPVLGKLADLRAPKPVSHLASGGAVWGQPKGADSGGKWAAVVTRPASGSSSPAPGTSSGSGGTATLTLKPSAGAWMSPSVRRAREAASQETNYEDVPDDWEDDV